MTAKDNEDRQIERDIRSHRRASLADTLAGRDGGAHLRGASPTPLLQRALFEVEQYLDVHLDDTAGSLRAVILRRLEAQPELLAAGLGDPARTISTWLETVLATPAALADLVRETDMLWGEQYAEKPHFDTPGSAPAPDDPYTTAGVNRLLTGLRDR